jgi:Ca-activated chloride channel family protein
MRTAPAFALAVTLAAAGDPSAQSSNRLQGQAVFRIPSSELVVLPVVVTDTRGQFVEDLDQARFTIYDNGRKQPIALFTNEDTPVSIALVVDESGSMRGKLGEVVAAALSFARLSHPEDELSVISFNNAVRDALGGRRVTAADGPELQAALSSLVPDGQTALYDALNDGLDHLANGMRARKVLVLVSDGGDNASRATFDDVLVRAKRSNVTIYTIGLFDDGAPDTNPGVLKRLADATGGTRFLPRSPGPLMQACARIAREIRTGYTIGYEPPDHDGNYHRLKVEIDAPAGRKVVVRTRPGYFAAAKTAPEKVR